MEPDESNSLVIKHPLVEELQTIYRINKDLNRIEWWDENNAMWRISTWQDLRPSLTVPYDKTWAEPVEEE